MTGQSRQKRKMALRVSAAANGEKHGVRRLSRFHNRNV